ncbi:hypothetical protein GUITHDRAFT_144455 [Guillardia theta CCMP2712]|uniref:Uncharacterized protein n=1 Tax=Guillardia theta (strain CCMP2712) TaxID=905079 RepID=L1IPG4_GUITC|nr:hypothetical protein GUITHDRAFT_144455 [Guillardia theta CCMP2712]EKX38153.1 hypothetical protein GUITHDRAFT_144455 [Guillardia theta CCMP2712]|eukprot:XP_005825133.1 hypothetical protein GUITHDRAFT_144455 [Guillardia theta CCMP2712]
MEGLQLIQSRANVNARDNLGRTPLHAAAYAGSLEAAKVLVKFGGDISWFLISLASPPQGSPAASAPQSPLSQRGSSTIDREEKTSRSAPIASPSKFASPIQNEVHYNLYTPARR